MWDDSRSVVDPTRAIEELKRLLPDCLLPDQVRIGSRLAAVLRERRQGGDVHAPWGKWVADARVSIQHRQARQRLLLNVSYPPELPISSQRDRIVDALRQHPVVVVAGETGSGKTTQLPKMCLESGLGSRGRIGCTQPRRVAALSVSQRIAEELSVQWGSEVGCKIRFADHSRVETSIKVMTDGILLAEVQGDPLLTEYDALVIDEAHERSINIDFLLGYLRTLLTRRDDLRVIITSATLDTALFSEAFGKAPVIEVSGRMYPVEIRYSPLEEPEGDEEAPTYVEAAVEAVLGLMSESSTGDALVFMPGERDILETCDMLADRCSSQLEILPLYGRLSSAEQLHIFHPGPQRRVVVATNIAETSITVPRIRYVVDSGLIRFKRYHGPTRSQRLPIEPASQSSLHQRAGRCGRVQEGTCVRLCSEEDYQARRRFTEPEIQRCNLAEVLLRMKAHGLGEIESFPFPEPPTKQAIASAYELLQELGGLDAERALTPLGRDLSRLPVDPSVGRMILQARQEDALAEVIVIAAALSIQDPRERPADKREEVGAAQQRFQHSESDFLVLLNIWNTYHDTWEKLKTQNQLRKFCRSHFLSYVRMREWCDLYDQLVGVVEEMDGFALNARPAGYDAIHRSILSGLLGHVGERIERNLYKMAGGREVAVHPGSGLCERGAGPRTGQKHTKQSLPAAEGRSQQPRWIVAGETVVTTRAYARTLARIEADWVVELGREVCRVAHDLAGWDREEGRVAARERILLRGLVLRERRVSWVKVQPDSATELFIRAALVEGDVDAHWAFLDKNRQVCSKIEIWQTCQHARVVPDLPQALFEFYRARLKAVGSVGDLNRLIKTSGGTGDFLVASPSDLLGAQAQSFQVENFPDRLGVDRGELELEYLYSPGQENDGVTVRLSAPLAAHLDASQMDWAVPALRTERLMHLLRLLPKSMRRSLMPLEATAQSVLQHVPFGGGEFLERVSQHLQQRSGVAIKPEDWPVAALPDFLRIRYEVMDGKSLVVASGRDLRALMPAIQKASETEVSELWASAVPRWERYDLDRWDLGDLNPEVSLGTVSGAAVSAWLGLQEEEGKVHLRLFRTQQEASETHALGVGWLAERALHRELAWLHRDLRELNRCKDLYVTLGPGEELMDSAWECLRRFLLPPAAKVLTEAAFGEYLAAARARVPGLVGTFVGQVEATLKKRHEILLCRRPLRDMRKELDWLVPQQFLRKIALDRLKHLPRYLQALMIRAERAALNPAKDAEKAARVAPHLRALAELSVLAAKPSGWRERFDEFRWLVEEYKVSVYAQELGTAVPASPRRLDDLVAELRGIKAARS